MNPGYPASSPPRRPALPGLFPALFGGFLGLTLLKFGNPPIMEKWVTAPTDFWEFIMGSPWPIAWAYGLLGGLVVLGTFAASWRLNSPKWIVFLPLAWLAWQLVASTQTIDPELSFPTLGHFAACCACFYLGYFCLDRHHVATGFLLGLTIGFLLVLATGLEQHFGGLERTHRYFYAYIYPHLDEIPPDYLKKMSSTRIFATLFYPNALAGAILLVAPAVLSFIGGARRHFTVGARAFLVSAVGLGAMGCLVWSGSKGGWLLFLLLAFVALLRLPFSRHAKVVLVCATLLAGLAAFGWKYAGFFKKGATSVVARFDYWNAALRTALTHPVVGTGPGTFAKPYQELKKPESEMARLVHNDYLEQASDSGWPGFVSYTVFVLVALVYAYPRGVELRSGNGPPPKPASAAGPAKSALAKEGAAPPANSTPPAAGRYEFALWLGVLGWALQGLLEFGLYIPALAWPAFTFLGWLLRHRAGPSFFQTPTSPKTRADSNRQHGIP